ncbi:D-alanyl-D-alanine carboxypeptidase family protein [Virgibacillus sp. W0430]|uniref:D-alanyl-D-alanine carboxypeptidase family protein n=1 Tax=Virgibacillus sp. W0430 TaxID=3391580 RepID=UPI003F465F57
MKKTIVILILVSTTIFGQMPIFAEQEEEVQEAIDLAEGAKSAILIEQDTGKILYDKNANDKLPPASMTKIMTLLLIMEELHKGDLKLEEQIRISERASSMGGSQIFLETGEEMSVENLLKGIAIASGNDASVALAERIAGSEESFVKMMNKKAEMLGLKHTRFTNSSGLPAENQYSTSHDMAIIAKELLKYEHVTQYTSIYEDYLRKGKENEFWLVNTNKLVRFYPGVDGLKTGFTNEAKYCLTATAKKDGMRVIAVVMGAKTAKERNALVSKMLDYAFNQFATKKIMDKNEAVTQLKLLKSDQHIIDVVTSDSISTLYKKGKEPKNITTSIRMKDQITLPLKKGDQVGVLQVKNNDTILSETALVVNEDIKSASYFTLFKRTIQQIAKSE